MKILITGGAGFIGSHTADRLLENGYEVRVLDSLEPPVHPRGEKPAYLNNSIEFIRGDVRNKKDVENALHGVNAVFHLAAYQDYLTDFSRFASVNDVGTALLYEVIINAQLPVEKVVIASSQAVYGEGKYKCPVHGVQYPEPRSFTQLQKGEWEVKCPHCQGELELLQTDEAIVHPHNQYAVSKYSQELYAFTLGKRYGIPTVALRYGITQGPRQSFFNAYSGILRIFTLKLINNLTPIIYEDGGQQRDFIHIKDVVDANILTLEKDSANFQVFNVSGGKSITINEYAGLIASVMKNKLKPQHGDKFRFGDTRHIISDVSKLRTLGWEPQTSFKEIIEDYFEWIQHQEDISDYCSKAEQIMMHQGIIRRSQS